ncbi:hypothetical protein [Neobacillus niacini]|nr:hypothetical protein [Neobacillus niacini]MDR7001039.1 hypothetical protein [Neobacillus niacini]
MEKWNQPIEALTIKGKRKFCGLSDFLDVVGINSIGNIGSTQICKACDH